ncbi:MAG: hypothetical protein IJJ47_03710 [Methanosphaera sp.]|nr:hypothetical protein [Methanosphaera sp.]
MDKKILIVIIALLLIIIGVVGFFVLNAEGNFGSSSIKIPKGFNVTKEYKHGIAFENNNTTKYLVKEFTNSSIDKLYDDCFSKYDENDTVINETVTIADTPVKTMTLKNNKNKTVHKYYFYKKNNIVYELFTSGPSNDTTVTEIISSTGNLKLF